MSENTDIDFIARVATQTAEQRKKTLSKALLNCHYSPPGYINARLMALQANAYHNLRPYPAWALQEWKTEERGTLPRCMPLPRGIVRKGAQWLFGKDVQITVPGNLELEESFRKAWLLNQMRTRLVYAAERGGVEGGIGLKWSYDETAEVPLRFQTLSLIDECRLFCDPHDRNTLLMVRIQYPVWNPQNGEWYLYREEWTDEEEVHYKPLPCRYSALRGLVNGRSIEFGQVPFVADGTLHDPDCYAKWEIAPGWPKPNPFGMIPFVPIRNIDTDSVYGAGDLWTDPAGGMFRVLDRINLAYHVADRSNQFDSEPTIAIIDGTNTNEALPEGIPPGGIVEIESKNVEEGKQAKIEMLEPKGQLREAITDYAHDLRDMLMDCVGSVLLDAEGITNKGNMTQAVMSLIFQPLIQTTDGKRQTYGENGICKALEKCALSLKRLNAKKFEGIKAVSEDNEDTYDCQLKWPDYFPLSEEEKGTRVTRIVEEVGSSLMSHERAIEEIAKTEGVDDVQKLKDELKKDMERQSAMKDAELETAQGEAKQAMNPPKPAATGAK
jgi:hypothetical protein